ncbi:sugar transferase [Flavivirga abyssicola]|uniref:sugar transferase n=1 Tax=Flavivirga abyssicola TaxID=3063533 RepID=UPI0026DFD61F|nr:sugar transferase [Flavivirga sp. MEBiC07777]WVK13006.1 sugar transferase [Flavivirga sp. MEBiC07777]
MYKTIFKRLFDLFFAIFGLIIFSPLFLVITTFLFISNKGSVFFLQKRPGENEVFFHIIKYKTMNDKKDKEGVLLPDSERLTKLGRILRKTSLDELPQLINVLIGNMSFIGPRPLLIRYIPYYTELERKRHSVKPGITGLAQISGRNLLDWNSRLKKDIEYVENLSFLLDLSIFLKTIKKVIISKDVIAVPNSVIEDLDAERK